MMKRLCLIPSVLLAASLTACSFGDSRDRTPTAAPSNQATVFAQGSFPTPTAMADIPTTIQRVPVVWSTSPPLPPLIELSKAKEPDDPFGSRGLPSDPKPGQVRDWSIIVSDLAGNERVMYNGPRAIQSGPQYISEGGGVISAPFITTESIPFLGTNHSFETYGTMHIDEQSGAITQDMQPFDPAEEVNELYGHGSSEGVQIAHLADGSMLVAFSSRVSRPTDTIWPPGLYRVAGSGMTAQLKGVTGLDELTVFADGRAILAWGPNKADPRMQNLYIIPTQNGQAFAITDPLAWAIQDPQAMSSLYPMPSTRVAVLIQEKAKSCCSLDLFDAETFSLRGLAAVSRPAVPTAMSFRGDFVRVGDQRVSLSGAVSSLPTTPTAAPPSVTPTTALARTPTPAPPSATPAIPSTGSPTPATGQTSDTIESSTSDSPDGRYTVTLALSRPVDVDVCAWPLLRVTIRDNPTGAEKVVLNDCRQGGGSGGIQWLDATHFLLGRFSLSPSSAFSLGDAAAGTIAALSDGISASHATLSADGSMLLLDGKDIRVFDTTGQLAYRRPTPEGYHISSAIWLADGRIAFVQEPAGWTPFRE